MLSIKDLIFKKRLAKKLTEQYISLYIVEEVVSINVVKLRLSNSMRIDLIVNISQVVRYRKLVEKHKVEEIKLIKVKEVEE